MESERQSQIDLVLRHNSHSNLVRYALARHGWGDTDGGFGTTYSTDLDDCDRHVDGVSIADGHVQLYGFWGLPDGYELQISESDYISHIIRHVLDVDATSDLSSLESLRLELLGPSA
ncbi:MAG: hypothetical protein Aurels2KO_58620 [Aureliella sp.]